MNLFPPDHPDAPKYWMAETSGVLAAAVKKYLTALDLDEREIGYIRAYLWQWVASPVWMQGGALEILKLRVAAIGTEEDIDQAIQFAVDLGMDPL